jgi:hypothetical protein
MKIERAWLFAACFGLVAVHFIGCSDPPTATTGPSSSGTASSGNGGAGGTGGNETGGGSVSSSSGMPPECTVAADCMNNGPVNFCGEPECSKGKCGRKGLQAPGTPLPSQLYGDCIEKQCDNTFNIVDVNKDDPYDDAKVCTTDVCTNGVLSHDPVASGTACSLNGNQGNCDGMGACVSCIEGGAIGCPAPSVCQVNKCVAVHCTDGTKNSGESDIDCGNANSQCQPCADNKNCTNGSQCASGICTATKCAVPTCTDMIQNGKETGFDCGGADCSKCPTDEGCATANDCQSGVCKAGVCVAPVCTDAVQNGDETGVDCGGACPACP